MIQFLANSVKDIVQEIKNAGVALYNAKKDASVSIYKKKRYPMQKNALDNIIIKF